MENLPPFIQSLKDQNKLNLVLEEKLDTSFLVGDKLLGKQFAVIAGPCSVENEDMIVDASLKIMKLGGDALRGGAYKPCTYPVRDEINGWKEGTRELGLHFLQKAKNSSGLQVVSEVMSDKQLELAYDYIDIFQVGTRNFQNYALLDSLAKQTKPVILKRGTWATIEEILGACERLLSSDLSKLAICLRGVIGAPPYRHIYPSTRWQPDIMMINALKEFTNIPIIYDPSHATGNRNFVAPISQAATAAGCDGLIIEAHPSPSESISDSDQAISFDQLGSIIQKCNAINRLVS